MIEFNRPIDPDSVNNDIEIVRTDSGGNAISYPVLVQPILDQSATRLSVALSPGAHPGILSGPGAGTSGIIDMEGNPLIAEEDDLVLGQFQVAVRE